MVTRSAQLMVTVRSTCMCTCSGGVVHMWAAVGKSLSTISSRMASADSDHGASGCPSAFWQRPGSAAHCLHAPGNTM